MPAKSSIGASAVALVGTATPVLYGVVLKAADNNSGTVYVGFANSVTANSADATDGMPLAAGQSLFVPAAKIPSKDAANIYLIGSGAGQKVFYLVDVPGLVGGSANSISVTADTEFPAASALADADSNPTTTRVGANVLIWNGTNWDRVRGDTTNGVDVDVTRLPSLAAGTNNIGDVDIASIAAGDNNIGNVDIASIAAGDNNIGNVDIASIAAGDNNIGNVDVVTVPSDPFGANADAASTTGSISAKIRHLASVGLAGMTSLPAGTNAIGKLAANSGVDIGDVDVTSISAGENHIGQVGAPGDTIDVTLSLDTLAYAAGDLLADTQVITNAVRVNGGRAVLQSLTVIDEDDQRAAMDIYFLSANNSFGTENEAPTISDASARDILGFISIAAGDYKDLGGVGIACAKSIHLCLEAAGGSRDLYLAVVTNGTPTHTASGVRLKLGLRWD